MPRVEPHPNSSPARRWENKEVGELPGGGLLRGDACQGVGVIREETERHETRR